MKRLLVTLSLLLTFGLSTAGVAAQVDAPDMDELAAESFDVEGLQSVYDRTYMPDFEAMMASPDADLENLDIAAMMRLVSIQGIEFDNEDNARAYLDQTSEEFNTEMAAAESEAVDDEETEMFESYAIEDLEGFDVDGYRISMDMTDIGAATSIIIFADGNHVFMVMVIDGAQEDADSRADEVTQFVLDAEIENDEVTFNMDGTSTGGVFDRMPAADDELVSDLASVTDTELYTATGE